MPPTIGRLRYARPRRSSPPGDDGRMTAAARRRGRSGLRKPGDRRPGLPAPRRPATPTLFRVPDARRPPPRNTCLARRPATPTLFRVPDARRPPPRNTCLARRPATPALFRVPDARRPLPRNTWLARRPGRRRCSVFPTPGDSFPGTPELPHALGRATRLPGRGAGRTLWMTAPGPLSRCLDSPRAEPRARRRDHEDEANDERLGPRPHTARRAGHPCRRRPRGCRAAARSLQRCDGYSVRPRVTGRGSRSSPRRTDRPGGYSSVLETAERGF
jgi:hypothetical protein